MVGDIKLFNDNPGSWQKVNLSALYRSQLDKKTKYQPVLVSLPENPTLNCGYHSECYKNFTAVSKPAPVASTASTTRQQNKTPLKASSSGVIERKCIFCNKARKKLKGKWITIAKNESNLTETLIRNAMIDLSDNELMLKIGNYRYGEGTDFVAMEVHYHNCCKMDFLNKAKLVQPKKDTGVRTIAFKFIADYINQSVIEENQPELASEVLNMYIEKFLAEGGSQDELATYTIQNLCKKLRSHFKDAICIEAEQTKKTVIWKAGAYTYNTALRKAETGSNSTSRLVKKCAMKLRSEILSLEKITIEEPVTVRKITEGEVKPPEVLRTFYETLYTGEDGDSSEKKKRLVESSAADAVFACSSRKLIPGKHLSLAFMMKSMTGSKGTVTLLNKLGHCASNETIRRIDIGLERTLVQDNNFLPSDLVLAPKLSLCFAWDNFDIQLETPSGHDTIHHTYGVCYQNKVVSVQNRNQSVSQSNSIETSSGKRKNVQRFIKVSAAEEDQITPYHKKPKMKKFIFETTPMFSPETFSSATLLDILWKMSVNCNELTPMWTGWNSRRFDKVLPQQAVLYMKHIPLPSTRDDVIKETMRRSMQVANECGEEVTIVSYDLLMAKQAKKIQAEESPEFDNLFIQFGQFHIMLSLLSSLGRIIEGSGGPYVLIEAGIVAPGSMNKFLKGKMFNRCRRGHMLLATALEGLHLSRFIEDVSVKPEHVADIVEWSNKGVGTDPPAHLKQLVTQYEFYSDATLQGDHGKIAQFWLSYTKFVDMFLILQRAVKTNDVELFGFILFEITSLFFVTNHQNYARWMSLYSMELSNLKDQRPEVFEALMNGAFSVNRTGNQFAGVGTDMALEQTINAHAKSRLKGIMQYADVSTAVNRWLVTSSMKTKMVNSLLEYADMKSKTDKCKDLRPSMIAKGNKALQELKTTIKDTLNPFAADTNKDALFNIKTGRQASEKVEEYLLNLNKIGIEARDNFVRECLEDPDRFEKPITKCKIINFATENFTSKNKSSKASEIAAVKGTRDLYARLLYLAVTNELSLSTLLQYPLLPEPPCFAHPDGSIRQSDKAVVFNTLKSLVPLQPPKVVNTAIVDGMFLIKTMKDVPATFSGMAKKILSTVMKLTSYRADLCFDVYNSPNIKDVKRKERGDVDTASIFNFGPMQKTPKDIKSLLLLSEFKKELLSFLFREFERETYEPIIRGKVFYCSINNECKKFYSVDGLLKVEDVPDLYGDHLEADTRVMLHAKHADSVDPGNIIVRANDTDIAIILLVNASILRVSHLWYDSGLDGNNTRRYTSITMLNHTLAYKEALPGVYAFTGCDYTPFFFRKGKRTPIKLMIKHKKFTDTFASLGSVALSSDVFDTLEEFTCLMYGYSKYKRVDDARMAHFDKKCKPKKTGKPFASIKSVDPSTFMPCQRVLHEQIKRAWYIAHLYKTASEQYPAASVTPIDFGWKLTDDKEFLCINWFDGDQVPQELEQIEGGCNEDEEEDDDDKSDASESEDESDESETDEIENTSDDEI